MGCLKSRATAAWPKPCKDALAISREVDDWEVAYDRLLLKYGAYHPAHTINNTIWCLLALLYGKNDLTQALGIAAVCGMDTDCNCASVGAVLGVILGGAALPEQWTAPLEDTLFTAVSQFREQRISDLARPHGQDRRKCIDPNIRQRRSNHGK